MPEAPKSSVEQVAAELVSADALLAGRYEMRCQNPLMQRDVVAFAHRADHHRGLATAGAAIQKPPTARPTGQPGCLIEKAAVLADRPVPPAQFFHILAGCGFVGVNRSGEVGRHTLTLGGTLRFCQKKSLR
jgi:hypothetical protein